MEWYHCHQQQRGFSIWKENWGPCPRRGPLAHWVLWKSWTSWVASWVGRMTLKTEWCHDYLGLLSSGAETVPGVERLWAGKDPVLRGLRLSPIYLWGQFGGQASLRLLSSLECSIKQWSTKFSAPGTVFTADNFSTDWGRCGDGFRMIQAHYVYCALYFHYYYISSTSDHLALDPGGWEPLLKRTRPWIWAGWMGEDVRLVRVVRKGRRKGRCLFCVYYIPVPGLRTLVRHMWERCLHFLTPTKI